MDLPAPPIDRTLIEALRERLARDAAAPVALVETPISWVLLAGELAYKLKKPVRLPFVDFRTLDARRIDCLEELRLNRRLAPALYLDVVPVCGSPQAPRIEERAADSSGDGPPIDYAVRMRRFGAGELLAERVARGEAGASELSGLARRMAGFHRAAPHAEAGSDFGMPGRVRQTVQALLAQLEALHGSERLQPLRRWIDHAAQALEPAWLARRAEGWVRECHGDLHLANAVRFQGELMAFDCVEFDPALRWIDVMSDVAFLGMDLKAHGRADLAAAFLDDYLQSSGDYAGLAVLRFYEVQRALVRAVVSGLQPPSRAPAGGSCPAPDYLALAERLAAVPAAAATDCGPRLMITHGLSGSGKSTLARRLLEATGAVRLRSDVERKRLFGLEALQRSAAQASDIYTPEATRRTFLRLREAAAQALAAGYPVIVDGAFLRAEERERFHALARALGLPFCILSCRADAAQLHRRVRAREAAGNDPSEADGKVIRRQQQFQEPLDPRERIHVFEIDTGRPVDVAALAARWLALPVDAAQASAGRPG
jgi:aminoglycoside phosphotransferase family enzyme/predicted kinase